MESGHTSSMRGAIKSEQEDPDLETMADRLAFQAQIASVIEILANSAVVEICKLVDDGYTALRCQMDQERERSRKENDVLRHKLQEMDVKIQSYERKLKKCDQSAAQRSKGAQDPWEETPPTITVLHTSVFSSASPPSQSSHSPSRPEVKPLKLLSNKLRSREVKTPGTVGKDFTESLPDSPLKEPKIQTDETTYDELHPSHPSVPVELDEPSPDHFKNLGLDQAWMQERVSSLGATYAVAQLGLRNTSSRHASSSSLSQGETDGVDDPLTSLYTDGTHTISALITSFDVSVANAAVVAAPPPPPPSLSTDSSANTPNQTQPVRSSAALAKDPVVCAVCRCVFSTVAALKLHRRLHIGDRPYTCPHCGKGFAQPNNLRVHLLVHTGERRYHCTLCGKSFISSSHLKRHHTVHTQEKPYSCSRCGQSFSQMCSVRRHRQQSQCGL